MAKTRIRRKELKAPDEFISLTARAVQWAQERLRLVTGVSIVVVAAVALYAINAAFRSAREQEANNDLGRGLSAMRSDNLPAAITQLDQTAERWSPSVTARLAALLAANAQIDLGKLDDALKTMEGVAAEVPDLPPYLQQQIQYAWAITLEKKGDAKEAAAKYAAAAELTGPYRASAILGEARMREQTGEAEAARPLYRRYLEEFPDMPNRDLIEQKAGPPQPKAAG